MVPAWGMVVALFWPGVGLPTLAQAMTEGTTGPEGMVWEYGPAGLENVFRPLGPTMTPTMLAGASRSQEGLLAPGPALGDPPSALTWTPLDGEEREAWPDGPAWGWYRTRFTAPEALPAGGYRLCLGRIGDAAVLFVNGSPIARHGIFRPQKPEEPLPFACCIPARLIRPGAANEVAMEVYREQAGVDWEFAPSWEPLASVGAEGKEGKEGERGEATPSQGGSDINSPTHQPTTSLPHHPTTPADLRLTVVSGEGRQPLTTHHSPASPFSSVSRTFRLRCALLIPAGGRPGS